MREKRDESRAAQRVGIEEVGRGPLLGFFRGRIVNSITIKATPKSKATLVCENFQIYPKFII